MPLIQNILEPFQQTGQAAADFQDQYEIDGAFKVQISLDEVDFFKVLAVTGITVLTTGGLLIAFNHALALSRQKKSK